LQKQYIICYRANALDALTKKYPPRNTDCPLEVSNLHKGDHPLWSYLPIITSTEKSAYRSITHPDVHKRIQDTKGTENKQDHRYDDHYIENHLDGRLHWDIHINQIKQDSHHNEN